MLIFTEILFKIASKLTSTVTILARITLEVNTFFKYWLNTCKHYPNTYKYCLNTCEQANTPYVWLILFNNILGFKSTTGQDFFLVLKKGVFTFGSLYLQIFQDRRRTSKRRRSLNRQQQYVPTYIFFIP